MMNYLSIILKLINILPIIQATLSQGGSVIDKIQALAPELLPILKEIGVAFFPQADPAKAAQAAIDVVFDKDGTMWVQNSLNKLGQTPKLTVDGIYGKNTKAAVTAYQTAHGLKVDGWCGPKTSAAIAIETAKLVNGS